MREKLKEIKNIFSQKGNSVFEKVEFQLPVINESILIDQKKKEVINKLEDEIKTMFVRKNQMLLLKMQLEDNEDQKLKIYDEYVRQKYIDDNPKTTMKGKVSDFFKVICKDWCDQEQEQVEEEDSGKKADSKSKMKKAAKKPNFESDIDRLKKKSDLRLSKVKMVHIIRSQKFE